MSEIQVANVWLSTGKTYGILGSTADVVTIRTGSSDRLLVNTSVFSVNGLSITVGALFVANSSGTYDTIGNVRDIVNSDKTAAYVLVAADNGKMINITTGGVTINGSIFSAGNNITIYNNSGSSQTITQGTSVTMYLAGTATTGNRTLAQRGICTVVCVAANTFVISGAGLT